MFSVSKIKEYVVEHAHLSACMKLDLLELKRGSLLKSARGLIDIFPHGLYSAHPLHQHIAPMQTSHASTLNESEAAKIH